MTDPNGPAAPGKTTQKAIAQKLGISQSLVAGVLGNRSGVWVSPVNRERILATARELNYQPNTAARALRMGKTQTVACVLFGEAGFTAIIENLADVLADDGYDLLIKVVREGQSARERLQPLLAGGTCEAVLLWGLEHEVIEPANWFKEAGIPFVVKGRLEVEYPEWTQADFDHEEMVAVAVRHLKTLGHERIAYIGFDQGVVYERRLLTGFLESAGSDRWIANIKTEEAPVSEALARWFADDADQHPTAAVIGTSSVTWTTLEVWLGERGIRISDQPGDFAVCGRTNQFAPLLFGQAFGYVDADTAILARLIASELILPTLRNQPLPSTMLRVRPELRPLPSLTIRNTPIKLP